MIKQEKKPFGITNLRIFEKKLSPSMEKSKTIFQYPFFCQNFFEEIKTIHLRQHCINQDSLGRLRFDSQLRQILRTSKKTLLHKTSGFLKIILVEITFCPPFIQLS